MIGFLILHFRPFRAKCLSRWWAEPLLAWVVFQCVYLMLAAFYDIRVVPLAFLTRILPIAMAALAYVTCRGREDFTTLSRMLGLIMLGIVPVALFFLVFGNDRLPALLQPSEAYMETGKMMRQGVEKFAGPFPTPSVLANTCIAVVYFSMAGVTIRRNDPFFWTSALGALLVAYASGRRGAFYLAALAVPISLLTTRKGRGRVVVWAVLAFGALYIADRISVVEDVGTYHTRSDLFLDADLGERLQGVFLPFTYHWAKTRPAGTFLGYAGREGAVFRVGVKGTPVEVGAAQIAAEMGILGLILFPAVLGLLWLRILKRARGTPAWQPVLMLVCFQAAYFVLYFTKELTSMLALSIGQLMFWAVPGLCAGLIRNERASAPFRVAHRCQHQSAPAGTVGARTEESHLLRGTTSVVCQ